MKNLKAQQTLFTLMVAVIMALFLSLPVSATHRASSVPLGTNITIEASSDVIWIFPGKRELDPEVFGTPDEPAMLEQLPMEERMVSEDGKSFTMTKGPTAFSDKVESVSGQIRIAVDDRTPLDNPNSLDQADLIAEFTDPKGMNEYKVELEELINVGPDHQFFGGVGTDVYMHGSTGIGSPLEVSVFAYVTLWGYGNVYRNGEMVGENRLIHSMVTPRVRDEDGTLGFSQGEDLMELSVHLVLPPTKIVNGKPMENPTPTGFELPNGQEQPFFHVNFRNVNIHGNRFLLDDITT